MKHWKLLEVSDRVATISVPDGYYQSGRLNVELRLYNSNVFAFTQYGYVTLQGTWHSAEKVLHAIAEHPTSLGLPQDTQLVES